MGFTEIFIFYSTFNCGRLAECHVQVEERGTNIRKDLYIFLYPIHIQSADHLYFHL